MLELVQFFDVYEFFELPVVLLNSGHQTVTSGTYRTAIASLSWRTRHKVTGRGRN